MRGEAMASPTRFARGSKIALRKRTIWGWPRAMPLTRREVAATSPRAERGEVKNAPPFPKKPECPCLDCQTRSNSAVTILP
ncbi:hypothetical protein SAMN05216374_3376 [Tardiphaga sp. OK246]|jgi:hypothetical protein|nr:hypothetical protein SAMN05216374_3376 [Tardiphaga sp. OK246]